MQTSYNLWFVPPNEIHTSYNFWLVSLSVIIAIFASFTALDLGDRTGRGWVTTAAVTLGGGIWSMHFVGMLAFNLPIPVTYDVWLTLVSLLIPILVTSICLTIIRNPLANTRDIILSGTFMGLGLVFMHDTGMTAMSMPALVEYNLGGLLVATLIAISASTIAFWFWHQCHTVLMRLAAAISMGVAISGMHYTGMASTSFLGTNGTYPPDILQPYLALAIGTVAIAILSLSLIASKLDRWLSDEARYRAVFDTASDGIVIIDELGIVQGFNRAAEIMFGYSASEVLKHNVKTLMPKPYSDHHDDYLSRYRDTGVRKIIGIGREMQGRHKNGDVFPLDLAVTEWHDREQRFFTGMVRDNSSRVAIQQQLIQSHKLEAIGQLAGGLAHDFNNILGVVIGNLDLIAEQQPSDELNEAITAVMSAADLVHRLLAFSRRQPLQPRVLDLTDTIRDIEPLLRRSIGARYEIIVSIDDDLGIVLVDLAQFENALLNLVINARDAMEFGGRIIIEAHNRVIEEESAKAYEIEAGSYVLISVSDHGGGIAKENLEKVFEPFFTTKSPGSGSGLGLSMVFGYVKQSGGAVKIYSEVGRGTVVQMFLLAHPIEKLLPHGTESILVVETPRGSESILVVEDFLAARNVANKLLTSLGYKVQVVNDATAAIVLLKTQTFDVLFTDVVMPGEMDGIGLAHFARQSMPSMKIVLTSGFLTIEKEKIEELHASFIAKPYRKMDIAFTIRKILDS